jgi:hypothetical protein
MDCPDGSTSSYIVSGIVWELFCTGDITGNIYVVFCTDVHSDNIGEGCN